MKKILALVLALALTLTAVAALAAGAPSPQNPGGKGTGGGTGVASETKDDAIELPSVNDTDGITAVKKLVSDGAKAGNPLKAVTVEVPADYTQVNEMVSVKFPEGVTKTFKFKKAFQTPYTTDDKIIVLIGIPGDPMEWIMAKGYINEEGKIVFTLSEADYKKVAGKDVVLIPVSVARK